MTVQQLSIALAKLYSGYSPGSEGWSELDYEALEYALEHTVERLQLKTQSSTSEQSLVADAPNTPKRTDPQPDVTTRRIYDGEMAIFNRFGQPR
jgi:hypothetical protein